MNEEIFILPKSNLKKILLLGMCAHKCFEAYPNHKTENIGFHAFAKLQMDFLLDIPTEAKQSVKESLLEAIELFKEG